MKRLSLDDIKRIELSILDEIDTICRENGIKYSLCYGSLLGAIRHKGFIPWDDDIDIMMLRDDYNRFISYCKRNNTSFELLCHETNNEYHKLYAKAVDKNTLIKDSIVAQSSSKGLFVDVFPIDYLHDNYKVAKRKMKSISLLNRILLAKQWKKYYRNKNISLCLEPFRFVLFCISRITSPRKLIVKIEKNGSRKRRAYSACFCGAYGTKDVFNTCTFDHYITVNFEGRSYLSIRDYSVYLESIFGDYMKLPPKEKRVSHHTFNAYIK